MELVSARTQCVKNQGITATGPQVRWINFPEVTC